MRFSFLGLAKDSIAGTIPCPGCRIGLERKQEMVTCVLFPDPLYDFLSSNVFTEPSSSK